MKLISKNIFDKLEQMNTEQKRNEPKPQELQYVEEKEKKEP